MAPIREINNQIVYTPADRKFAETGVGYDDEFAVADRNNIVKQVKFDVVPTSSGPGTVTIEVDVAGDSTINLSSIATNDSFTTIQPDHGTSPVATSANDTLTLTSSDNTVIITGNSATKTINFQATGVTTTLTTNHIFVGNASNVATDVAMSGDATIVASGAVTVTSVGTSTAANIHSAELLANAATSANTANAIVRRGASGEFSMGALTATGASTITGGADVVQLTVKGNSTQTSDIFDVLKSDNTNLFKVTNAGNGTFSGTITASNFTGTSSGTNSGTNTGDQTITLTGDVTGSGTGTFAATIANSAVTNAKMANMANNTVKANKSGGSAAPSDLALSSVTETGSSIFTISNGSNTVVSASNLTVQANLANTHIYVGNASGFPADVAMSGDTTIANTGAVTIANSAVTNAKMANMANNTVKANKSGGSAAPSDLALSSVTETGSSILTISNGSNTVVSASNLTIQHNLNSANIYVGNVSNVPVGVAVTGDVSITNAGVTTINKITGGAQTSKTANYTITATDFIVFVDTTSAAFTLTLPAPATKNTFIIKDIGGALTTNNLTIARNASEKIENVAASKTFTTDYGSWTIVSDATNWWLI